MMNEMTGRSRGLAYITYEHEHDAADAKDGTDGLELDGRRIRVDFAINKRAYPLNPGQYFGSKPTPRNLEQSSGRGGGSCGGSYGGRRSPSNYRRLSPSPN